MRDWALGSQQGQKVLRHRNAVHKKKRILLFSDEKNQRVYVNFEQFSNCLGSCAHPHVKKIQQKLKTEVRVRTLCTQIQ